jgi:hypothetical protein
VETWAAAGVAGGAQISQTPLATSLLNLRDGEAGRQAIPQIWLAVGAQRFREICVPANMADLPRTRPWESRSGP